jgi:membrane protease YdiL (CAAX protease family)
MVERFLANFLIDFLLIFLPIAFFSLQKKGRNQKFGLKDSLQELGFCQIPLKQFLKKTILLTAALIAVAFAISFLLNAFHANDLSNVAPAIESLRAIPLLLVYIVIVRSSAEEVFFRGFLTKKTGALVSSILFALIHLSYGSYAEVAGAFILGFIFAKVFQLNKNLYPNIAAHIAFNAVSVTLMY